MSDNAQRPPYGQPPFAGPGAPPPQGAPPAGYGPPPAGYGPPPAAVYGGGPAYRGAVSSGALEQAYVGSTSPNLVAQTHRSHYGDAAGEYLAMPRGRFNAWVYVVLAFIGQAGMLGALPGALAAYLAALAGAHGDIVGIVTLVAWAGTGFTGAYFTYRDRWRCIEAFSSRFCAGIMNISLLYVPLIAFVYANVRGIQKIFGK